MRRLSAEELREYGERFAADNLAYVDSEFVPQFDRMRVRIGRWTALAWGGVFLPGLVVTLVGPDWLSSETVVFGGAALASAGIALLHLRTAGREFPAPPGRAIVARAAPLAGLAPLYLRRVCERPESAVDQAHLYFQDAWRAQLMRGVVQGVLIGTLLLVAIAAIEVLPEFTFGLLYPGGVVVLAVGLMLRERSRLWFRKRLWPGLAPGQVIRPGEEVAA